MKSLFTAFISSLLLLLPQFHLVTASNLDGLPLKTRVYTDASCSRANHLYYLNPNFCVGPLFEPSSSIRVAAIPSNCRLVAFEDGRCQGAEVAAYGSETAAIKGRVARRQQQVIAGPSDADQCFGLGEDYGETITVDQKRALGVGANSFFLSCEA